MDLTKFFGELKRRNVYKVAVAYIVAGWALSQGVAQVFSGVRHSELGDSFDRSAYHHRFADCSCSGVDVRADAAGN
jgi:hypothetical protein